MTPRHPARWTPAILDAIRPVIRAEQERLARKASAEAPAAQAAPVRKLEVCDPMAGVGGVHALACDTVTTTGIELEPEWAEAHPDTAVGDALALPFGQWTFDAIVVSPSYGNRMADSHDAQERCQWCKGTGRVLDDDAIDATVAPCPKCDGKGVRDHVRNTYRHALGRQLTEGSSSGMPWGQPYREFHRRAWAEAHRVLRSRGLFVLNVKDHVRGKQIEAVSEWHLGAATLAGFRLVEWITVPVHGNGQGENREARVPYENVFVMRRTT